MSETPETARVPAGVPTGGQFATSARAEAEVALTVPAEASAAQRRACRVIDDLDEVLADLTDAVEERNLVDDALRACPEAAYVTVTPHYQSREDEARWQFLDHDEKVLGSGFAPFRPSELDRVDEDGYSLDVADVLDRDFDAVVARCDDALIASLRERRPEIFADTEHQARLARAQAVGRERRMIFRHCATCAAETPHVTVALCGVCWT